MNNYEHTQPGTYVRVIVLSAMILSCAPSAAIFFGRGAVPKIGLIIPIVVSSLLLLLFHSLTVRVTKSEIGLSFGIGLIHKTILIADIESCSTVKTRWYHGWGIKAIRRGWMFNISGFDAIEVRLKNGRVFWIGTNEPTKLLAAINASIT